MLPGARSSQLLLPAVIGSCAVLLVSVAYYYKSKPSNSRPSSSSPPSPPSPPSSPSTPSTPSLPSYESSTSESEFHPALDGVASAVDDGPFHSCTSSPAGPTITRSPSFSFSSSTDGTYDDGPNDEGELVTTIPARFPPPSLCLPSSSASLPPSPPHSPPTSPTFIGKVRNPNKLSLSMQERIEAYSSPSSSSLGPSSLPSPENHKMRSASSPSRSSQLFSGNKENGGPPEDKWMDGVEGLGGGTGKKRLYDPAAAKAQNDERRKTVHFAAGCFWSVELQVSEKERERER